jgi:hypothetical protein
MDHVGFYLLIYEWRKIIWNYLWIGQFYILKLLIYNLDACEKLWMGNSVDDFVDVVIYELL